MNEHAEVIHSQQKESQNNLRKLQLKLQNLENVRTLCFTFYHSDNTSAIHVVVLDN